MSTRGSRRAPAPERRKALARRIALAPTAADVALVPDTVLVRGAEARARVQHAREQEDSSSALPDPEVIDSKNAPVNDPWVRYSRVPNALAVVAVLRADGLQAQPEHVFFAHGCCDPCATAPHPSVAFRSLDPSPYAANPHRANPHRANPHRANPHRANEALMSTAMPADGRAFPVRTLVGQGTRPRVTVLDTGLAGVIPATPSTPSFDQCPALLTDTAVPGRIAGDLERPDSDIEIGIDAGQPTMLSADGWLDPVAGHGTFIAGLIEQLAPGCRVRVTHVINPLGDAREGDVCQAIIDAAALPPGQRPDILSMSFGGSVLQDAPALRSAIARAREARIVAVASAGNDGSPLPQYPAAFDQVVGVGALGPDGPAPWTNYGGWVDACAPGVDLVSAFFAAFDGPESMINGLDPDDFLEWATWSGTSFAAPVVVAALAREMVLGPCAAEEAVERIVHAPHLLRLPCLGTVINV